MTEGLTSFISATFSSRCAIWLRLRSSCPSCEPVLPCATILSKWTVTPGGARRNISGSTVGLPGGTRKPRRMEPDMAKCTLRDMPSRRLVSLLLLASCAALAQDGVHVTALKDPVSKSYRKMVEGMDLFEEKRAMAPGATLRFKLLPRKRDTRMDQIQLELVGYSDIKPLELAADRTFTIGRDEQALKEDALVRPNRRAMTMTWRAEIRSPDLPPGTRRLGDLRLECEVGMRAELISNRTAFEKMMDAIFG